MAEIFKPEKNCGNAVGNFTWKNICILVAPIARMRSMESLSTLLYPSSKPTVIGKKVVITTRVIFGAM